MLHPYVVRYIKRAITEFIDDECPTMAAAMAYYTVFSLPALLVIIISIAGYAFSQQAVEKAIEARVTSFVGQGAAAQVSTMVHAAHYNRAAGIWGTAIGAIVLLVGATTAFAQLQTALNRAWEVEPDAQHKGIRGMLRKRVLSFVLILAITFLLLVSVAFSTSLSRASGVVESVFGGASGWALWLLSSAGTFVIITILFGIIYKVLPDAVLHWEDVLAGSAITAALFTLGNNLLGLYLGRTRPGAGYGTAGSIILILLWIYYSSIIVLFGAEVTQVYVRARGRLIQPKPGAVRTRKPDDQPERPAA